MPIVQKQGKARKSIFLHGSGVDAEKCGCLEEDRNNFTCTPAAVQCAVCFYGFSERLGP